MEKEIWTISLPTDDNVVRINFEKGSNVRVYLIAPNGNAYQTSFGEILDLVLEDRSNSEWFYAMGKD